MLRPDVVQALYGCELPNNIEFCIEEMWLGNWNGSSTNHRVGDCVAPSVLMWKCPWAKHWTLNCSWWLDQHLVWLLAAISVCVWMSGNIVKPFIYCRWSAAKFLTSYFTLAIEGHSICLQSFCLHCSYMMIIIIMHQYVNMYQATWEGRLLACN